MKDIADYFRGSVNNVNNTKSPTTETEKGSKSRGKTSPTTPKLKIIRNKICRTPRRKNKLSPRTSPLEGFNLLFNLSKNESPDKKTCDLKMEKGSPVEVINSQASENSVELHDGSESTNSKSPKLNAFQLLMMGRNKVIGTNSPGKELPEQGNTKATTSPKLLARKRLLQSWSDSIKSKKRKLNDEEIDKYIKVKLNTRKERLKSLLNVDNEVEVLTIDTPKSKKKSNSSKNLKISNESIEHLPIQNENERKLGTPVSRKINKSLSSGDDFETQVKNGTKVSTSKLPRAHRQRTNSIKMCSTPKSTWKMKIKLINRDSEEENSLGKGDEENEIIILDESENSIKDVEGIEKQSETVTIEEIDPNKEVPEVEEKNISKRVLRDRGCLNKNKSTDYLYLSDDSGEEVQNKSNKKVVKVAPVFAKAMPKQKIDPNVLEARRKFLMSDMPDVLRKKIEKHTSNSNMVDEDFDVFPKVSHVHQEEKDNILWNLPCPNLRMKTVIPFKFESIDQLCQSLIEKNVIKQSKYKESEPIKNIKTIIRDMKLENENYPVYKAFRLLKEKNSFKTECTSSKTTPKRGRKHRSSSEKKCETSENVDSQNTLKYQMWTEKYKPRSSEDFFSNVQAVSSLKKWLEKWREVLESGKRKRRQYSSDSDSEFMSSDAESIYDRSLSTTIVLTGPCGSGKSSSVYAVCNELGLNVLELNASSRRTGKQIIQELQEATQSHQVRKNKGSLDSFTNKGHRAKPTKETEKNKSKKMCVLLIEDIDIVFEQDDGFLSAISQISSGSKRPIVLTTSNENSVYALKFINDFKTIRFYNSSVKSSGIWLQILCLLEGIFIDLSYIGELLEYNRGDIRKTLLELQYWVQSGGQTNKNKTLLDPIFKIESLKEDDGSIPISDDTLSMPLKEYNGDLDDYRVHSNILSDFEIFQLDRYYNIPLRIDLKTLWWNIPKFLYPTRPKHKTNSNKSNKRNKKRLKIVSDMYDSVVGLDIAYRKIGFKSDDPVCRKRWHCRLQDSLELDEISTVLPFNQDMLELNHYLTNGHLGLCKEKFIYEFSNNQRFCNMAMPTLDEEKKLNNNHKYERELLKPVPSLNNLDHKSIALDYLPCLRTIARTENIRAKNNVKRHNRFHNYLQNFNITCDNPILDFAAQTFSNSKC
ncbi:ATPase family AAA domain-containing protein 5 [Coccinella septempunctata]|uniref:ATPase family AAA domain-containing protein 5 n=1 Tax=Coccinella septempunctata TaxID=41139 RepID=UPI001D07FE71|nr:ATPase family AAA domain-containing protein 5 [Coccinella septempunctata]